ncbi:uncharacterized protein LOC142585150 [Dermacentor variabilis]|uniref:uncharacterized protein LOC142585150 n=1 Tax=Dermacentor variabilis TaxID=34621 RepID=UPI003F5BB78C
MLLIIFWRAPASMQERFHSRTGPIYKHWRSKGKHILIDYRPWHLCRLGFDRHSPASAENTTMKTAVLILAVLLLSAGMMQSCQVLEWQSFFNGLQLYPKVMLTEASPARPPGSGSRGRSRGKKCGNYYCEANETCEPSFVGPACTSKLKFK